jgi:seryl-tRNA synthetase
MLDPQLLRAHLLDTAERLKSTRGFELDVERLQALEAERKQIQTRTQELQSLRNSKSKEIGALMGQIARLGASDAAQAESVKAKVEALKAEVASFAEELTSSEQRLEQIRQTIDIISLGVPNLPGEDVPLGGGEAANVEKGSWGTPRAFDFTVKDHVELGAHKGWLDGDAGAKLSGARFTVLRGELARLHRALAQYMLDLHTGQHGYLECNVPLLVLPQTMQGTGQLPKFEDDLFATFHRYESETGRRVLGDWQKVQALVAAARNHRQGDGDTFQRLLLEMKGYQDSLVDRYLIPTSEVPLTNLVRDSIVEDAELPMKLTAHSMCCAA